jgi:O-antigen/teichoic acid export membrane protein
MAKLFSKNGTPLPDINRHSRNIVWNSVGMTVYNITSPLFLIMVTRFGKNGIEDAGVFSLAYSISIIILAIACYGMRVYQVTDVEERYTCGEYGAARVVTSVGAFLVAIVIAILSHYELGKAAIFLSLAAAKTVEGYSDVYFAMVQKHGRLDLVGKSILWKSLLGMLLFSAVILATRSIFLACLGLIFTNIIFLFLYDRKWAYRLDFPKIRFSLPRLRCLLTCCFPLFAVSVIALYLINIPRYAVDRYMTAADLGIYGIIFMQATVVSLLTRFLLQPFYTVFAERYCRPKHAGFVKIVLFVIASVFAGAALLDVLYAFWGVALLKLLFGVNLSGYTPHLLIILSSSAFFNCATVWYTALTAMRLTRIQLYISLASVAVGLVISSPVVARWGILGAVAVFCVLSVFQFLAAGAVFLFGIRRKAACAD